MSKASLGQPYTLEGKRVWVAGHRGLVGSALVRRSSEQLAAAGFRYSVAFCTSPKSVAVFAQSGFERWGGQTVATFEHAGRRWFEHVPDEWAVMVRKH